MSAAFEAGVHIGLAVVGFVTAIGAALIVLWLLAILLAFIAERVAQ